MGLEEENKQTKKTSEFKNQKKENTNGISSEKIESITKSKEETKEEKIIEDEVIEEELKKSKKIDKEFKEIEEEIEDNEEIEDDNELELIDESDEIVQLEEEERELSLYTFCKECDEHIFVKYRKSLIDNAEAYPVPIVWVHGKPLHGLLVRIDKNLASRGERVVDVEFDLNSLK